MTAVEILGPGLAWLWRTTWQASVLVLLVILAQWLFRSRLAPRWRYALWWLVLIRLMLPVAPGSAFSIFNVVKGRAQSPAPAALISGEFVRDNRRSHPSLLQPSPAALSDSASATTPTIVDRTVPEAGLGASQSSGSTGPKSASSLILWGLIGIWVAGMMLMLSRLIWGNLGFARRMRRRDPIADPALLRLLEECRRVVGVSQPEALIETPEVDSPALFGCFKVKLLLPLKMAGTFSPAELRHVFLHELSHVRRWDVPTNWLMTLVQIVHWFNPVIWLASSRMRADRELACDALALSLVKEEENQPYGQTIIKFLEGFVRPATVPGLVGILEEKTQMKRRIHMIAKFKRTSRWSVLAVSLLIGLGLITLTDAQNKTEAEKGSGGGSGTQSKSAEKIAAPGTNSSKATSASVDGDVIDPCTGLRFVVSKTITGADDVIEYNQLITLSPNGKFLLWNGRVVPLDGSPAFTLKELKGARIAAWSPDRRKIAFNLDGIEVLPISPETGRPTGTVRKLLEDNGDWFRGRIYWSSDSERILFVKRNSRMELEVGTISLRDGRLNRQPDYADFGILSPDGKMVAYSMPQDGIWAKQVGGGPSRIARSHSSGLFDDVTVWTSDSQWVVSAIGGWWREEIHFARVLNGQNFDVFPPEAVGGFVGKSTDGKKLYFYRSSFDSEVTSKVVPILGGPALDTGPSLKLDDLEAHVWSSDSASLAVLGTDREGNQQLWSIPLTGEDRVRFNIASLGKDEPWLWSLSSDGSKALYSVDRATSQGSKRSDFYVVPISLKDGRATGSAALVFEGWQFPSPSLPTVRHAWSPDGTKIVMPHKSEQGNGHWILSTDGSKPIQITQTPDEAESYPRWSPDGQMIAFYRCGSDREMLQVIRPEGGTARTLLTAPKGQFPPFGWYSDSKDVMVACNGTITGFPVSGGSARVVVRLQDAGYESASWLSWSPDGQRLAFYGGKRGEASRLCLFYPTTGKISTLDNTPKWAGDFTWSPDSKMICCTAEEAQKTRPAGVLRELDVAEAVQKAAPIAERKPAVANPQAEPIAGPVFTDNFDNGPSKHWRFQGFPDEGPPVWHAVENGQLVLANARACLYGIDWTDYIVTVRVCMKEVVASGEGCIGIAARAIPSQFGSSRMDRYDLGIFWNDSASPCLWLGINYADASDTLRHGILGRSQCKVVRDKWYTLEFEIRGQQLRAYLDGKLVVEATDARLSKGGPLWLNAWRSRVLFDDFSVRQLP